jgi:ABC-type branched-subunit amino acid transport system permease subunit
MGNSSIQSDDIKLNKNRAFHIITIVSTELIIFLAFINFLLSQGVNYRLVIVVLPIIGFFILRNFQKAVDRIAESYSKCKAFSIFFGILLLIFIPFVFKDNTYLLHICIIIGIYLIITLGLNIQLGSTGLVNFAFAAFFGVGAYTSALLAVNYNFSFWIGILAAIVMSAVFGLLIGSVTLKSTGFYYALVTMAFQIIFHLLVNNLKFTGGSGGISNIPFPAIGNYSFMSSLNILGITLPFQANFYYLLLVMAILSIYIVKRLYNSRTGLIWNAIREDEIAAKCQGIDIAKGKLEASAIGAIFGGVAGAIYAHYITFISPESFTFHFSVVLISMVIIGGLDNITGVAIGAILLTIIPEKVRFFAEARMLLYGIIIIVVLVFKPQGLIPEKIRKY